MSSVIYEYEKMVAMRLNKARWCIPKVWKLDKASRTATDNNIDPYTFVLSQFEQMPEVFCKRVFRLSYPPASAMNSEQALTRFKRWKAERQTVGPQDTQLNVTSICNKITKDLDELKTHGESARIRLVDEGHISAWTIAYMVHEKLISIAETSDLLRALSDRRVQHVNRALSKFRNSTFEMAVKNGIEYKEQGEEEFVLD
jgi:hypothetical protein